MSGLIHLWDTKAVVPVEGWKWAKCGLQIHKQTNMLFASTAASLKIPPDRVCKVCYRLGPPWLGEVK